VEVCFIFFKLKAVFKLPIAIHKKYVDLKECVGNMSNILAIEELYKSH